MNHHPMSDPFALRLLDGTLDPSRRVRESLGDADPRLDLPSLAELLTIERSGFPRTYNLNDGMGPDSLAPGLG